MQEFIRTLITVQINLLSISPVITVITFDVLLVHLLMMTSGKQNNLFICSIVAAALAAVVILAVTGGKL